MKRLPSVICIALILFCFTGCRHHTFIPTDDKYPWLTHKYDPKDALVNRITPPSGYVRLPVERGSFGEWLRGLPLKKGRSKVKLYNGQLKPDQTLHYAVIDIDTGREDLQQCADAVMRLRAEYMFVAGKKNDVHFNFTSGDKAEFRKWARGYRPIVLRNTVKWTKTAKADASYDSFRRYLKPVFSYAGTASLEKELKPVPLADIRPGDVFIQGGHPGHAEIVLDVAENKKSKKRIFILAQGYMPAQDMHILRNYYKIHSLWPWFETAGEKDIVTPSWMFRPDNLRRFE